MTNPPETIRTQAEASRANSGNLLDGETTLTERGGGDMNCEGLCEETGRCVGDVSRVRIFHPPTGYDWGEFWYCETAQKSDRDAGLTVTLVRHEAKGGDGDESNRV